MNQERFKYQGGGYFRDATIPKGQTADIISAEELVEYLRAELDRLEKRLIEKQRDCIEWAGRCGETQAQLEKVVDELAKEKEAREILIATNLDPLTAAAAEFLRAAIEEFEAADAEGLATYSFSGNFRKAARAYNAAKEGRND